MNLFAAAPALTAAFSLIASASCQSTCAQPVRHPMNHHRQMPAPDLPKACHAASCCSANRRVKPGAPEPA